MKDPLKGFKIAATGGFGGSNSIENIRKWVVANGGESVSTINSDTTHLVTSVDMFEKGGSLVKAAQRYKNLKIVTFDWLEDCLQSRARKREGAYLIQRQVQEEKKAKHDAKKSTPQKKRSKKASIDTFEAGCNSAKSELFSGTLNSAEEIDAKKAKKDAEIKAARASYLKSLKEAAKASAAKAMASKSATASQSPSVELGNAAPMDVPSTPPKPVTGVDMGTPNTVISSVEPSSPPSTVTSISMTSSSSAPWHYSYATTPVNPTEEECHLMKKDIDNHHIYVDATGFLYDIMLVRIDFANNLNERFTLRLYESHTKPASYACHLRGSKSGCFPKHQLIVPIASSFAEAFAGWRGVFHHKTRLHWEMRFSPETADVLSREYVNGHGGVEAVHQMGIISPARNGQINPQIQPFKYTTPNAPQPLGLLPPPGVYYDKTGSEEWETDI